MSLRLLAGALALVAAGAAPAAGAWSGPERASVGPLDADSVDVAVNMRGDGAAAWVRGSRRGRAIVVTLRRAGGGWERPVAISRRGRPAIDPQVAIAADGRVIVVWRQVVRNRVIVSRGKRRSQAVYVVRARERAIEAGRWEPIVTLSSRRQKVGRPFIGTDDAGRAVAAWHWGTGNRPSDRGYVGQVQLAERDPAAGWGRPRRASRSSSCVEVRRPRVASGAAGHTVVWWICDTPGGRSAAHGVGRGPGEGFGPDQELPLASEGRLAADLAVAPDGRAVAVSADDAALRWWRGPVAASGIGLGDLPALGTSERVGRGVGAPRIAAGPSGDALSAWIDPDGRTRVAPIAADLGVAAPTSLGQDRSATRARVATGDARRGLIAWLTSGRVVAAVRAPDGSIGGVTLLSRRGVPSKEPAAIAMDATGAAVVYWTRVTGGRSVVERATFSAT